MDKLLLDLLHDSMPKINEDIANGLAVRQMQRPEVYVDRLLMIASEDFPPEVKYKGYTLCTPREEVAELIRKRTTPTTLELSRRDWFMVKYHFSFNNGIRDEELVPWCLFLPIVQDGGLITFNGSLYQISPVAVDEGLSIGQDEIFLKVNSNRLKFHRLSCEFLRGDEQISTYAVWSRAHNKSVRPIGNWMSVKGFPTLAHYLFAKYGLTRTFNELANCDVRVGLEDTINTSTCPPDTWMICRSAFHLTTNTKPRGVKDKFWRPSNVLLAVPKDKYCMAVEGLIAGFFYVLDLFPKRIEGSPEYVDNPSLWRILLGIIYWGEGSSEGKYLMDINAHLDFLDKEIDTVTQASLATTGVYVNHIYDLFMNLIETYNTRVTNAVTHLSSMYGKRLCTMEYVMHNVQYNINGFKFSIQPGRKKALTKREVESQIWKWLKTNLVLKVTDSKHSEVNSISIPGDNKFFKGSSTVIQQSESGGLKNTVTASDGDPLKYLHASIAEVGSVVAMAKSEPTGRNRINPYVRTEDDKIVRNPAFIELLDIAQKEIER